MENLVSVIIPVYNSERYLSDCIDSVLSQSYTNIEIILVDDGSTDSSPQICNDFCKNYKNILVLHQKNSGVSAARNAGVSLSNGEYITFLDSDDMLTKNAISSLLCSALKSNADLTIGSMSTKEFLPIGTFTGEWLLSMSLKDLSITYSACRILYKHSFISDILFEHGRTCSEDSFFVFQCALRRPIVTIIDDVVYFYRENLQSVTHTSFSQKKYNDITFLLEEKEKIILEYFPHLEHCFYNLKFRIQMQLLLNMAKHPNNEFKLQEKKALKTLSKCKKYFDKKIPYNKKIYFILTNHLYYVYKVFYKLKNKNARRK